VLINDLFALDVVDSGKEYVLQGIWSMRLEPDKHVCES
jgi:hypothetical protein